jgi:hypothetical protein
VQYAWITVAEAASRTGRSQSQIRRIAPSLGVRHCGRWLINPARLRRWSVGLPPDVRTDEQFADLCARVVQAYRAKAPQAGRLRAELIAEVLSWLGPLAPVGGSHAS